MRKRFYLSVIVAVLLLVGVAAAQEYPLMNMIAECGLLP
jgi:hypothetical protein